MQGINDLFSTIMSLIRNTEVSIPDPGKQLLVGQQIEAYVISGKDKMYLIQAGQKKFYAQSELPLPVEHWIKLYVDEQKDGRTWLKIINSGEDELLQLKNKEEQPVKVKEDDSINSILRQAIKRFGVAEEKELSQVREFLQKLPLDEKTAVRYLLDPHLLGALMLPMKTGNEYSRVEINKYKGTDSKQNVYEVVLNLELDKLGHLEIMLRMIEEKIYTRIWADSVETESILQRNKEELSAQISYLEIVPMTAGPLIVVGHDDLDVRI